MNRTLLILTLCVGLNLVNGQHTTTESEMIPIKDFIKLTGMSLKDIPIESMIFKDNDTLMRVQFKDNPNQDLISVPYDYRSKKFTDLYKKVAFKDPNVKDTFAGKMRYWKDEMRIYFSDEVSRTDKKGLTDFALQIAEKVDSLKIRVVKNIEEPNYIVYYKNHYEYESRMGSRAVDFYMHWNGGFINKAALRVDADTYFNEELRLKQLKRYFIKTLGYFENTNELDCNSYFSTCVNVDGELSQLDIELLQYHYSYGFCKGVTLDVYQRQLESAEIFRDKPHAYSVAHYKSLFAK